MRKQNKSLSYLLAMVLMVSVSSVFAASDKLFQYKGKEYSLSTLPSGLKITLHKLQMELYRKKLSLIDLAVFQLYLDEETKKTGKSKEFVVNKALAVDVPSDAILMKFYERNKAQIPYPFEKVKDQLQKMIMEEKAKYKQLQFIQDLKKNNQFKSFLMAPEALEVSINTNGFPVKGSLSAKVTIIKFADYQCPHCKHAAVELERILNKYEDQVNFIYMDYPINRSGISRVVAEGAVCADEQKKFWEYNAMAFEQQTQLSKDSPLELAKDLSLNIDTFKQCLASNRPAGKVKLAEAEAQKLGLTGTPAIFVNNKKVNLVNINSDILAAVKEAIEQTK